jgi:hypothetical protein
MSQVNDWIFVPENSSRHAWDLEKENFAWIDFAWSALGQSWDSGQGLETVYEKALDDNSFGEVLSNFSTGLAGEIWTRNFDFAERALINQFLSLIFRSFAGTEKGQTDAPLSPSGVKELFRYVEGPLHAQIGYDILAWQQGKDDLDERVHTPGFFKKMDAPQTTFIFGHTHKPFARQEGFHGYKAVVEVYNSGGWVVETLEPKSVHGGSIVLVDDQLNTASIHMYNETSDDSPVPVRMETNSSQLANPLAREIGKLKFTKDPWNSFSKMVAATIPIRRRYLRKRVYSALPRPR